MLALATLFENRLNYSTRTICSIGFLSNFCDFNRFGELQFDNQFKSTSYCVRYLFLRRYQFHSIANYGKKTKTRIWRMEKSFWIIFILLQIYWAIEEPKLSDNSIVNRFSIFFPIFSVETFLKMGKNNKAKKDWRTFFFACECNLTNNEIQKYTKEKIKRNGCFLIGNCCFVLFCTIFNHFLYLILYLLFCLNSDRINTIWRFGRKKRS